MQLVRTDTRAGGVLNWPDHLDVISERCPLLFFLSGVRGACAFTITQIYKDFPFPGRFPCRGDDRPFPFRMRSRRNALQKDSALNRFPGLRTGRKTGWSLTLRGQVCCFFLNPFFQEYREFGGMCKSSLSCS